MAEKGAKRERGKHPAQSSDFAFCLANALALVERGGEGQADFRQSLRKALDIARRN